MVEDFDKTLEAIETICDITEDVQKDLEDRKLSLVEGGTLAVKYGLKAVKIVGNIKEIGIELADVDSEEASEATQIVLEHFGGSDEAKEAIKKIATGSAMVYEGTKTLLELRKKAE